MGKGGFTPTRKELNQESTTPRNWSISFATELARLSAFSCVLASAYTLTTSSVPEGRIKHLP